MGPFGATYGNLNAVSGATIMQEGCDRTEIVRKVALAIVKEGYEPPPRYISATVFYPFPALKRWLTFGHLIPRFSSLVGFHGLFARRKFDLQRSLRIKLLAMKAASAEEQYFFLRIRSHREVAQLVQAYADCVLLKAQSEYISKLKDPQTQKMLVELGRHYALSTVMGQLADFLPGALLSSHQVRALPDTHDVLSSVIASEALHITEEFHIAEVHSIPCSGGAVGSLEAHFASPFEFKRKRRFDDAAADV